MMRPLSDLAVAWLRTVLPAGWAAGVAWLVTWGAVPDTITDALSTPGATAVATTIILGLLYPVLRWLEGRLPAWVTRLLLGATTPPVYPRPPS